MAVAAPPSLTREAGWRDREEGQRQEGVWEDVRPEPSSEVEDTRLELTGRPPRLGRSCKLASLAAEARLGGSPFSICTAAF